MQVVQDKIGSYHVYLSQEELEQAVKTIKKPLSSSAFSYPHFSTHIVGEGGKRTGEWMSLECSNDSRPYTSPDGIAFKRTEDNNSDINVKVFTLRMMKQEDTVHYNKQNRPDFETIYTQGFLMAPCDKGKKIWIRPEPIQKLEQNVLSLPQRQIL